MMKVAAYLNFKYNASEAVKTYRALFDAQVVCEHRFEEGMTQNRDLIGKVFHAELKIGDLNLYLSDTGRDQSYSSIKFVVEIKDEEDARLTLEKFAKYGRVISDFKKGPVGPAVAQAEDQFGIHWEIVIC